MCQDDDQYLDMSVTNEDQYLDMSSLPVPDPDDGYLDMGPGEGYLTMGDSESRVPENQIHRGLVPDPRESYLATQGDPADGYLTMGNQGGGRDPYSGLNIEDNTGYLAMNPGDGYQDLIALTTTPPRLATTPPTRVAMATTPPRLATPPATEYEVEYVSMDSG